MIGNFNSLTGWSEFNNDTTGFSLDLSHILDTASLEFDKVDGTANTAYAGVSCQLATVVDAGRFTAADHIQTAFYVSDLTDIAYAFIRLGTVTASIVTGWNEWRIDDSAMTAGVWNLLDANLNTCEVTVSLNGWNPATIGYIAVGIMFDLESNTLADIRFDHVLIRSA
jgi:hypothetical protein